MCINNGYGVLPFVRFFLVLKSHEGFSVVFEMFLGLFVLLIRVSESCCVLKALPPAREPPVPLVFFVFYVPYQSIGIGENVKSLFKPFPLFYLDGGS